MSELHEQVEAALSDGSEIVAYQVGQRYPRFAGCPRVAFADVLEAYGYSHAAKSVRECSAPRALQAVISRRGKAKAARLGRSMSNGLRVDCTIMPLDTDNPDVRSFGIYLSERPKGERGAAPVCRARVYACPDGTIAAARPVDTDEHPAAVQLAEEIAKEAHNLVANCEVVDVSAALCDCYEEAGALPFLGKGSYLVRHDDAGQRLVACLNAIRGGFYDEDSRQGIRARAVAVTARDRAAVSDAVIDSVESRVAELAGQLRSVDGKTRASTLESRRAECAAILRDIDAHRELLGQWAERFAGQAAQVRQAFDQAVAGQTIDLPDWLDTAAAPEAPVSSPEPAAPAESAPEAAPEPESDAGLEVFDL